MKFNMRTKHTTEELESALDNAFEYLQVTPEHQIITGSFVKTLKDIHVPTYEHSIRVGLKSIEVAEFIGIIKPSDLFYPGLLHDIGKKEIRRELLDKRDWNEQDAEEMRPHAEIGAKIIEEYYEFSSWVIRNSHKLSKNGIGVLEKNPKFSVKPA